MIINDFGNRSKCRNKKYKYSADMLELSGIYKTIINKSNNSENRARISQNNSSLKVHLKCLKARVVFQNNQIHILYKKV